MKKIILVRHTEKIKGFDSDITSFGEKQTKEIASFLKTKHHIYDYMFTSLYKRSISTGELINSNFKKPSCTSGSFNEYYVRPDNGEEVESVSTAMNRALTKLYSVFDMFESVLIVAHNSILSDMVVSILNLEYKERENLFKFQGEVVVIRYDYKLGDSNWRIIDKFVPKESTKN